MDKPIIDHEMSDADYNEIVALIDTLSTKLTFLKKLNNEQRQKLIKMGAKNVGFVNKIHTAVHTFPDIFSKSFNKDKFKTDKDLYDKLQKIKGLTEAKFFTSLDDSIILLKHQQIRMAYSAYSSIKLEAKQGGEPVRELLKELMDIKKRETIEEHDVIITIKKGKSKIIDKIKTRSRFRNKGETLLEVHIGSEETKKGIAVSPGSFIILPKDCKVIFVINKSADTDGKCKVKIKNI